MSNFVFYDFETSSSNKAWGQIIEIGAILTDDDLNELDRFEAKCRLAPGVIPEAMSLIVSNTTPKRLKETNLSHYQMVRQFVEKLKKWGKITYIGWNNIDFDHCDHFSDLDEVISSFKDFAANSKKLLINFDCETSKNNFYSKYKWSNTTAKKVTYAIIPTEINSKYTNGKYYENGNFIGSLNIPIPGLHNLSNITAAIAASRMIGVDFIEIKKNIKYLKLPKKRFEFRGQIDQRSLYDDYAHHPNEIKETIKLGRLFIQQKNKNECQKSRLIAIFQPHRYSRVKQFTKEFAEELSNADVIYVTSIHGAGEANENKITSKIITDLIYKKNKNVSYINNYYEVTKNFYELTEKGDLILNMGAGDCHNFWSILNEKKLNDN